ncbi:hypothetical protein CVV65_07535 [Kyrpidia spormannii]|uniref:Uncharacterized protein n=1 Tax=Kyrpidia spormannii TaxID=2055160 RepID=A0A2K8N8M1_9BACL|nr:hypothetical protein [Kyrpidia spormannii]ATY84792.1 hypothetical protein CVV65_07535 [Kyrpidia spormannii]
METRRFRLAFIWQNDATGIGCEGYLPTLEKRLFFRGSIFAPKKLEKEEVLYTVVETLRQYFPNDYLQIKGNNQIFPQKELPNVSYRCKPEYLYNGCERLANLALDYQNTKIQVF